MFAKAKFTKKTPIVTCLSLLAGSLLLFPVSRAGATSATANTTVSAVIANVITMSTGSTVTLNVTPTGGGVQTTASDTVTVSTNDSAGYTLGIADASASDSNLISGSNTIAASAGTQATPVVMVAGTWGYCVTSIGGFGANCPGTTTNAAISATFKFAGMPFSASPNTIKTTAATASNDTTTVWYGVAATSSQVAGTYSSTVTYTATAN